MLGNIEGENLAKYVKDYVIFDLETTGTSCKSDEVVEISAIRVLDEKVDAEFSTLVNPGIPIPFYASQVNGITDKMVADAPDFKTALGDFIEFIGDLPLVGHNIIAFDMKFIYRDCRKYFNQIPGNNFVDTLKMSRTALPQLSHHKLVDVASYYGISTKGAHRALNDCHMNQQIFHMLGNELEPQKLKSRGVEICPRCSMPLKLRSGKFGQFLGCTSYPACRFTMNVPKDNKK